jgi:hypothetical protein
MDSYACFQSNDVDMGAGADEAGDLRFADLPRADYQAPFAVEFQEHGK